MSKSRPCPHTRLALHRRGDIISFVTCDECGAIWNEKRVDMTLRMMVTCNQPDEIDPKYIVMTSPSRSGVAAQEDR